MIASVPAIWALTALFFAMVIIAVYLLTFFTFLFGFTWALAKFAKLLQKMIMHPPKYHD